MSLRLTEQQLTRKPGRKPSGSRERAIVYQSEAEVLKACQELLESHPRVSLWWRQSTGAGKLQSGNYVKFSFRGAPDLMGILTDGRFMACEVKATGKKPTDDQRAFLRNVLKAGGLAVCVDHAAKLEEALR